MDDYSSRRVEKIDNGWLTTEVTEGADGYKTSRKFTDQHPDLVKSQPKKTSSLREAVSYMKGKK